MTSMRRFQIGDRGRRAEWAGSAAAAVVFVVCANLLLFGLLAAVLLPRSDAVKKAGEAQTPDIAMVVTTASGEMAPDARSIAAATFPAPAAALARPSVTPDASSLVLARSAPRVPRFCPGIDSRRVSVAAI